MGQHKYNTTATAAKNNKLQPKSKKKSKRQLERDLYAKCSDIVYMHLINTLTGGDKYVK